MVLGVAGRNATGEEETISLIHNRVGGNHTTALTSLPCVQMDFFVEICCFV